MINNFNYNDLIGSTLGTQTTPNYIIDNIMELKNGYYRLFLITCNRWN